MSDHDAIQPMESEADVIGWGFVEAKKRFHAEMDQQIRELGIPRYMLDDPPRNVTALESKRICDDIRRRWLGEAP